MSELSKLLKERNVEGWSAREVARRAQRKGHSISEPTATALFGGRHGEPRSETLRAVAAVLPVTVEELRSAAGLPPERRTWEPPEEVNLLAPEIQDGIADLIKVIARQGGQQWGTGTPGSEDDEVAHLRPVARPKGAAQQKREQEER